MRQPRTPTLSHAIIKTRFPTKPKDDPASFRLRTKAELAESLAHTLHAHGDNDLWVFGYGSLMWKPEKVFGEGRPALLNGWHRRFCLWQWRYRGSRTHPGLVLALDRGGSCRGMAYPISAPNVREKAMSLWEREMIGNGYIARWVRLTTMEGPLRALVFVANHASERYAGRLTDEAAADSIAKACGQEGASAEYLLETVLRCEQLGIHDRFLWRLQELVAERMQRATML